MSLEDEVRELKRQVSELSRRTADIPVRFASGGTGGSGSGDSGYAWGTITTPATAGGTDGTPSNDCRVTLFTAFGGDEVQAINYSFDPAPTGRSARVSLTAIDGVVILDWWSCAGS